MGFDAHEAFEKARQIVESKVVTTHESLIKYHIAHAYDRVCSDPDMRWPDHKEAIKRQVLESLCRACPDAIPKLDAHFDGYLEDKVEEHVDMRHTQELERWADAVIAAGTAMDTAATPTNPPARKVSLHGLKSFLSRTCSGTCRVCGADCTWNRGHGGTHECRVHMMLPAAQRAPRTGAAASATTPGAAQETAARVEEVTLTESGYRQAPAPVTAPCGTCGHAHVSLADFSRCTMGHSQRHRLVVYASAAGGAVSVLIELARVLGWL